MPAVQAPVKPIKFVSEDKRHVLATTFGKDGQTYLVEKKSGTVARVYGIFRRWHSDFQGKPSPAKDEGVVEKLAGTQKEFSYFKEIPDSKKERVKAELNGQEKGESAAFSR